MVNKYSKQRLYDAFKSKDSRFDGRFFVGISSTGIYCRPVCRARQPKLSSCSFYTTAAEAECSGYRPCLLCRPELSPDMSAYDNGRSLAVRAARLMDSNCSYEYNLKELSEKLGCSDRHLRRVFAEEYNVSPVKYLQTSRLLMAKGLLTDTSLPITEIAFASGFGSLRRFNDLFINHYNLSPSKLRKKMTNGDDSNREITILLGYRPPYQWKQVLTFLVGRTIQGIELIKDDKYYRSVQLDIPNRGTVSGWVRVEHRPDKNALQIGLSEALLTGLPQIITRLKNLFDLSCEPLIIYDTLKSMNKFKKGVCTPGIRVPGSFDSFEMTVRAVLGQQITVKAAQTLASRVVTKFGTKIETGIPELTHVFPTPSVFLKLGNLIENHLGPLGIIARRSKTILALAQAHADKSIDFDFPAEPEMEIEKLMDIPGIGSWTAKYIAMRTFAWPDAFLETDAAVKNALKPHTPRELVEMSKAWQPWRSYATMNIWNSL